MIPLRSITNEILGGYNLQVAGAVHARSVDTEGALGLLRRTFARAIVSATGGSIELDFKLRRWTPSCRRAASVTGEGIAV